MNDHETEVRELKGLLRLRRIEELEAEVTTLRDVWRMAEADVKRREAEVVSLGDSLFTARDEVARQASRADIRAGECADLFLKLKEAEAEVARLTEQRHREYRAMLHANSEMQAEIERLTKDRDDWKHIADHVAEDELERLKDRCERLRAALEKYGKHDPLCRVRNYGNYGYGPCECGLSAALAGEEE